MNLLHGILAALHSNTRSIWKSCQQERIIEMGKLELAIRIVVLITTHNICSYSLELYCLAKYFAYEVIFSHSSAPINCYNFRLFRFVYSVKNVNLLVSSYDICVTFRFC